MSSMTVARRHSEPGQQASRRADLTPPGPPGMSASIGHAGSNGIRSTSITVNRSRQQGGGVAVATVANSVHTPTPPVTPREAEQFFVCPPRRMP